MNKLPRYEKYKDSGAEWLGQVPEHWETRRLGYFFDERREKVSDKDYEPLSVTKNGVIPQMDTAAKTDNGDNRKRVAKGDFVINSRSDRKGSSGISVLDGSVSLINIVLFPKVTKVNMTYMEYLLKSDLFQEEFYRYGRGIVADLWSTPYSEMKNIIITFPPVDDQQAIVTFLDLKTAKIDALVEEQERMIKLLKERQWTISSYIVTKGLDPNVKMKNSGIEWLGEVPEHWEVLALKRIVSLKSGESINSERIEDVGDYPVFGGNGLRGFTNEFTHEGTYPLIGRQGALCGNINYSEGKFWASEHAVVVSPVMNLEVKWLGELLRVMNLNQYSISAAQPGLSVDVISNLYIPLPPLEEQRAIGSFLEDEFYKLGSLISESENAIELLRERRNALIVAAVTGKIDVRTLVEVTV